MRRRFFVDHFENQHATLHGDAAHHLGRVLRAQPGQLYELSDGTSAWLGRIDLVERDRIDFTLLEQLPTFPAPLKTSLLLSVVKFDAFEWALEKATELGIARIVPLAAARSEKALLAAAPKRSQRWEKILFESAQQSRRVQLPVLEPLATPDVAFSSQYEGLPILLSESPQAVSLSEILSGSNASSVTLAIGPEGGWTDSEFAAARCASFREASLGKLILRTETAVIASLAVLNYALGKH
ncbi:MAG TPA: RsmE family RNA methyltransferase [Verrucomicrobiae bacterium]|nr:RsmE family RNA methyltransferase [Verrucomicrobiae bacterium]